MSKYRAIRTNGYASRKEANRAVELRMLADRGIIQDLKEQVRFQLLPANKNLGYSRPLVYVADFVYVEPEFPRTVVEDAKGFQTPVYKLKKRLMRQLLNITIAEV